MIPDYRDTLTAIARTMAARGAAQILTHDDAANDPSKLPSLDPANEALLRRAYAMTAFPDHKISFETVMSTTSYAVGLINIAARLRKTGRL